MATAYERFLTYVVQTDCPNPDVEVEGPCWLWTGGKNAKGYGVFWAEGKSWLAHRWSKLQKYGPPPSDTTEDHMCRTTSCVNPDHLETISNEENVERAAEWR